MKDFPADLLVGPPIYTQMKVRFQYKLRLDFALRFHYKALLDYTVSFLVSKSRFIYNIMKL